MSSWWRIVLLVIFKRRGGWYKSLNIFSGGYVEECSCLTSTVSLNYLLIMIIRITYHCVDRDGGSRRGCPF